MRSVVLAVGLVVAAGPGWGQNTQGFYYDGQSLYDACKSYRETVKGYVAGVFDRSAIASLYSDWPDIRICSPQTSKTPQIADVVCKYLEDHPEERHYSGALLTAKALQQAFPCP